jgi:DNA-binding transcriptional LysR family regulator
LDNDLGFISSHIKHKKLIVKEVLEDRLVLIVPPDHPFTKRKCIEPKHLEGQPFIMHEKGSASRSIVDDFIKKNGLSILTTLELSNNEAIKKAVKQGIGLSLISEHVVSEEVENKKLKIIPLTDHSSLKRKFYMIHHKDKYLSQPLQILIDRVYQWASEYTRSHA